MDGAVDVAGVLRRRVLVAQFPRPLVVGLDHHVTLALVQSWPGIKKTEIWRTHTVS